MPENPGGKLADPDWRRERARKAARARTSPEHHLDRIREAVIASRVAQGLPPIAVDDLTLANVAELLGAAS